METSLVLAAGMLEIHLSHNMLTLHGAAALLEALPVPSPAVSAAAEAAEAAAGEAGGEPTELGQSGGSEAAESEAEAQLPTRPLWLRLEWNRVSLGGLMQVWLWGLGKGPRCSSTQPCMNPAQAPVGFPASQPRWPRAALAPKERRPVLPPSAP